MFRLLKALVEDNETYRELNVTPLSGKVRNRIFFLIIEMIYSRLPEFSMQLLWVVLVLLNKYIDLNQFYSSECLFISRHFYPMNIK
jgi:hypothetical protein